MDQNSPEIAEQILLSAISIRGHYGHYMHWLDNESVGKKKDLVVDGWSTPSVAASALEIWRCPKDPRGRHGMTTKIRIETHGDHWGSPCDLRNTHMSSERMKNQEVSGFPRLS